MAKELRGVVTGKDRVFLETRATKEIKTGNMSNGDLVWASYDYDRYTVTNLRLRK